MSSTSMTITADRLLDSLKKKTTDPELRALLAELGVSQEGARLEDGFGDIPAIQHGIRLFFKFAQYHGDTQELKDAPPTVSVLSDVTFTALGYKGGPPFSGELPYALKFSDTREMVHGRFGAPASVSIIGIPNERWNFGERYLTIDFRPDYASIKKVTVGIQWNLVR
jgi:hypothetical protein